MRSALLKILLVLFIIYAGICTWVYFNQESLLFIPESVARNTVFKFDHPYEELDIRTDGKVKLNGIYFPCDSSKGLVFFVHGNAGNLQDTKIVADAFLSEGYDFFVMDFRGFGKSGGKIESEEQFYKDVITVFDSIVKRKSPENVIIAGYSVGTAAAVKVASMREVEKLVLMAPYYSMKEVAGDHYPVIPSFILSYPFETHRFLPSVKAPAIFFHGKNDGTIRPSSSGRLKKLAMKGSKVVLLPDCGHNDIVQQEKFQPELHDFLSGN